MQTTIIDVEVTWQGVGAKKYGKAVVKHDNGKGVRHQNLVSFKNPEVFKQVQELIGQTVEVDNVKDGDFWTWKSINPALGAEKTAAPSTSGATATRASASNYETREERAARQVLIVKQSSLSAAVETLSVGAKTPPDAKTVLALAQQYVDWVFTQGELVPPKDKSGFDTMTDDIPF